ncbi:MAG: GxxExxY protein [Aureliella sp.]
MPIQVDSEIRVFSQDAFHSLADKILGIVFDVHNSFGCLMNEDVYKQAICARCESAGIVPARREIKILVSYLDFQKWYYMDLLFVCGLMLEGKVVEKLTKTHYAQALHYLLLTGMRHGLLVNMRSGKVEKQYISTTLDLEQRRRYVVWDSEWLSLNDASQRLRTIFTKLLDDWGAFLQLALYRDAIIHFFGGPERVLRGIPIYDKGVEVGSHMLCQLADDTALALTALKEGQGAMRFHLQRFLSHTRLRSMQWINMDNHDLTFRTLVR